MAQAKHDNNQVPAIIGVLNTDGATPTRVKASPTTHALDISDGSDGSDFGEDRAARDDNGEPTLIATDTNGNKIPLYVNSDGALLIKST